MPSLKDVRNRITSVGSTMQITSAMKMVSAAKLKRASDAVQQMRPYANKLKEILENLSAGDTSGNPYTRSTGGKNILIVAISSNRGLAGGFNSNIIKKTWSLIRNEYNGCTISVLPVGKKVQDAFKRSDHIITGQDLPNHLSDLFDNLKFENAAEAAQKMGQRTRRGGCWRRRWRRGTGIRRGYLLRDDGRA